MNMDFDRQVKDAFEQIVSLTPDIGPTPEPKNPLR